MRVLHLYSNWKWTGPAEHALATANYLFKKDYDLTFACGHPPIEVEDSLAKRVRETGLPVGNGFYLNKHFHVWQNALDLFRLVKLIKKMNFNLIHTHLVNDHMIAAMAAQCFPKKIAIIRTVYDGMGVSLGLRNRVLFSTSTDGLITVSEMAKQSIKEGFGFPLNKIWKISPGVDCERFNESIDGSRIRTKYGVSPQALLVGIVARVQPHRRFDIFLKAIKLVVQEIPQLKVFIIGRGTHIQEVAINPVQEMGLANHICFTGYQLHGYPEMLSALDMKVFLVPGSDGSCRAVREAMAMGKPVIVANRGMLPEIVEDGVSGFVVDDTPENLARAITVLARDSRLRTTMGEAGRKKMYEECNLTQQLEKIEEVYRACAYIE